MTSQPRLSWTVDQLDVRPAQHVLEIGCGHGIAAALVLDRLTSGHYVGLDRSASMVAASERRNQAAVGSGRARFVCSAFADADSGVDGHLVACISAAAPAGQTPAAPGGRHARGR